MPDESAVSAQVFDHAETLACTLVSINDGQLSVTLTSPSVSHIVQVSKASADLMNYCNEHARNDPLLMGIPASDNPFKDKKPCTIL